MSLLGYLIMMFDVMFWGFRVVVAVTTSLNIDFGIKPVDLTTEIIVLFITLLALVLIVRRRFLGAIIYIITYGWYFGSDVIKAFIKIINGESLGSKEGIEVFLGAVGLLLAFATFSLIALSLTRKGTNKDKKTDWFYKNENFDRVFDERADRNTYKFR